MQHLIAGQRVPLDQPVVALRLGGPRLDQLSGALGGLLLALDGQRRAAAGFPPLDLDSREPRPGADHGPGGEIRLDLAALPPSVERLLFLLYLVHQPGGPTTFAAFEQLALDADRYRLAVDLGGRADTALVLAEIYRRGDGWRLCANGQGFAGGIGALFSALGIDVAIPERAHRRVDPAPGPGPRDERPPPGTSYTGSGFAVDARHVITNAHVVEGMRRVEIAGDQLNAAAEIAFVDPRNDMALLRVLDRPLPVAAAFRDGFDLHLGEDIIVLGFPLQGLLGSGPQASAGNVSALCGIGNDSSVLQFTAPIASGNSGGPILDMSGHVVGLVYSSLNKDLIRQGGSNAENINFGVKAAVVRAFLSTTGITPQTRPPAPARSRADVVRDARAFLYRIRCEA